MPRAIVLLPRFARRSLALGLVLPLLAGCSGDHAISRLVAPRTTAPDPGPLATSATAAAERLRWCWETRALAEYRGLFTSDFVFVFGAADSAGSQYRDLPWVRADELVMADHMFAGGSATQEAATSILIGFTSPLRALPDTRPGKDARVHRELTIDVVLRIDRASGSLEVRGASVFFVVRGDSAALPPGEGLPADSTRWYIERWEDRTSWDLGHATARSTTPAQAMPARAATWGSIKSLYR
jgi:hypothetical protein